MKELSRNRPHQSYEIKLIDVKGRQYPPQRAMQSSIFAAPASTETASINVSIEGQTGLSIIPAIRSLD